MYFPAGKRVIGDGKIGKAGTVGLGPSRGNLPSRSPVHVGLDASKGGRIFEVAAATLSGVDHLPHYPRSQRLIQCP